MDKTQSPNAPGVTYQGHANEQVISDPVHIRALAHPFRLELLDYLDEVPQATATECAEALAESVASCSYHLRTLAKHGYIEQVDQRGREKPWKAVSHSRSQVIDRSKPGAVHAVAAMASLQVSREFDRILSWLHQAPQLDIDDVDLSSLLTSSFYATRDELRQFREDLLELSRRFDGRWSNPELRPSGSVPVRLFGALNVDPDGGPRASASASKGSEDHGPGEP